MGERRFDAQDNSLGVEMRQVARLSLCRGEVKRKLPNLSPFHRHRWFNQEENPPIADIFQYSLAGLRISLFRLLHDKSDRQMKLKSRMTSIVHGNSSNP